MGKRNVRIADLMRQSGVGFGTSGARGLASDMIDEVCYAYTTAFIQYLERSGELEGSGIIGVGGDLRPSTGRIMRAVAKAIGDKGYAPQSCGRLPSPALAYYGLVKQIPTVMVTGSHIPEARNGIKYTKREGEILKHDESGMKRQTVELPDGLFDDQGMLTAEIKPLLPDSEALDLYVNRYLDFFERDCLKGKHIGVYQHSSVGRELMLKILEGLGAKVTSLGFSENFIPVDTEAIRPEDVQAAKAWASEHHFDAIVSADGDSDRPLISDETGKWLRGDLAGILCSEYLGADAVVAPVSCNSALEKSGLFKSVYRTRIGSPFVIEGMQKALKEGAKRVVGYEANGGFLLASDIHAGQKTLRALPTRDAVIVHITILLLSKSKDVEISQLVGGLPRRFTFSDRLKNFPTKKSKEKISELYSGNAPKDREAIETVFGHEFGDVDSLDTTDGLRITFVSGEVVHLRPSGNAPEFRCYTEADTETRAIQMNRTCMAIMEKWR
jgi:phosphomannomutase